MGRTRLISIFIYGLCLIPQSLALPSLVVSNPEVSAKETKEEDAASTPQTSPKIYQMHVRSKISNRFANTTITSKVKNVANQAQEATFSVVLPETAFISGFVMEVNGKNYTAYVKEKEEAKRDYDQAVASGLGAAHVAVSARDSNRFTVSVNVEPETKAAFYLTYEELLKRDDGHYEQVINLHPGQPVKDLSVEVVITESRKITDLKAPPLRTGNEIGNEKADLDPRADIEIIEDKKAVVRFTPNIERQKQLAHLLGTEEKDGLSGQFVVQYDVERDPHGGEVLIQDGYFVHFFAPSELAPLPKYVVFVLDTSGSMYRQKIAQLKEAMHKILEQLHDSDLFSLIEFNSNVKVWDLNNSSASVWYPTSKNFFGYGNEGSDVKLDDFAFPRSYPVNSDNIKKAKATVSEFNADGGTDIYSSLKVGLHLVELEHKQPTENVKRQPIIVFLTDGDPTVRVTSTEQIISKISEYNVGERRSPIFTLSFGSGADKKFLQKISLHNSGFSKHIYEAADASLQLQDFYKQISSPLLANVTFKYEPSVTSLTKTEFPIYFGGSELVVSGWCGNIDFDPPSVGGWGIKGPLILKPSVKRFVSNVERLWAYLTVKQLLDKKETDKNNKELQKKALDLALRYSFVTSVTSLVVVKPNHTSAVDTEEASKANIYKGGLPSYPIAALPPRPGIAFSGLPGPMGASVIPLSGPFPESVSSFQSFVHRIPATTTIKIEESTTSMPDLLTLLPWLNSVFRENGILDLPSGDKYKLGLNETISDVVVCSNTPLNTIGHCSLLHSCPQVHSTLTSLDVFVQHMCVLKNEYAGICCPDKN